MTRLYRVRCGVSGILLSLVTVISVNLFLSFCEWDIHLTIIAYASRRLAWWTGRVCASPLWGSQLLEGAGRSTRYVYLY